MSNIYRTVYRPYVPLAEAAVATDPTPDLGLSWRSVIQNGIPTDSVEFPAFIELNDSEDDKPEIGLSYSIIAP